MLSGVIWNPNFGFASLTILVAFGPFFLSTFFFFFLLN